MAKKEQIEALEHSMPKAFSVENKLVVDSSVLPEVKDWKTGVDYRLKEVIMTQIASRELENGRIQSEFEIKRVVANSGHKK